MRLGRNRYQRALRFAPRTKAAQEQINCRDHQQGICRRRHSRGAIAHSENGIGSHRLPVIKSRLFQPGLALKCGAYPVVAFEHLSGDLCVARFISAEQSEGAQAIEKKKSAERNQQQHIGTQSCVHSNVTPGGDARAPRG